MYSAFSLVASALLLVVALAEPASAHPHILITIRSEIDYGADAKVAGLRQYWTYDPAYSTFITRDLQAGGNGELGALAALAKSQMESFAEYGYFTAIRSNGSKIQFGEPTDYSLKRADSGRLMLSFTLPLKSAPASGADLAVEVFDPNFFAYFSMAEDERAVRLIGAPEGCKANISGPKPIDLKNTRTIPALFWQALDGSAVAGQQFVNRIVVTCP